MPERTRMGHHHVDTGTGPFEREVAGLAEARPTETLHLSDP
jgi:hypothetical protein